MEDTLKKLLIVGALAFAATSIAQNASAAEFYVVRDARVPSGMWLEFGVAHSPGT